MMTMQETQPSPAICTCLALRQAARQVTQFYDRVLGPSGLRTSQVSLLARLKRSGPMTVHGLAEALAIDRTTLGRNVRPLQRLGLVTIATGAADRRRRELRVTDAGAARLREAVSLWREAQARFENAFGGDRAAELRDLLRAVSTADFDAPLPD
jgi:DNA-binding MarR family transcriptional regulator